MPSMTIAGRAIGPGHPVFCVAELSGNAGQDFDKAVQLIYAALEAGADAVKSQVFCPTAMTIHSDAPPFRLTWAGQQTTLWDLYSRTAMPLEWHSRLKTLTEALGMVYFVSVFDGTGVDFCQELGMPAYKVASFELVDIPLLQRLAATQCPIILSTGMATEAEINDAVTALARRPHGTYPAGIALLRCVSAYPADPADANLRSMVDLANIWLPGTPVVAGLSDHTLGIAVPVVAVALGACVVEKHLTLSRADGGPDAAFSLEPGEFRQMVEAIRIAEQALGEVRYGPTDSEQEMLALRRSLWVVRDVRAGELLSADNMRSLRPTGGLAPRHWDEIIGKRAARDCTAGEPLTWEMIA